jgi:DNA-binding NtrC family response regulator
LKRATVMKYKGKIFIVDDDTLIVQMLSRALENEGYDVQSETANFKSIVNTIKSWLPDVVLLDIKLPDADGIRILDDIKSHGIASQVVMLTSDDNVDVAVKCIKLGAEDYLTKPFNIEKVKIVVRNVVEKGMLKFEVGYLRGVYSKFFDRDIIGKSLAINSLKAEVEKLGASCVPSVLITGESGTGKELFARRLHRIMKGDKNTCFPFIAVNCCALPETLLESELFGYEKGAFTDAKTEGKGIFQLANGGTILLDEIGDMKFGVQSKLLRVLEERTLRRVGGHEEIPIDVLVIATTNTEIAEAAKKGEFRRDLFYRLNTFSIHVLPLRERKEDIPMLSQYFLKFFALRYKNKTEHKLSPESEKLLSSYSWPGNVRELKNIMEKIVVLQKSEVIMPEHLPKEIFVQSVTPAGQSEKKFLLPEEGISIDALEKDLILQALERTKNNKMLASKLLNMSYDSLRYQIKKFNIDL